ncbi:MAG: transcription termination factor NusA [Planctomycetota bacterium]
MNGELLRIVEAIHQDKEIDKEIIFKGIEAALLSAAKKRLGVNEELNITIDRESGDITAERGGSKIDPEDFGRIAALTAKQVILQKIKEAERDVLFQDYEKKQLQLVTGTIQRHEGQNIVVNLGKTEGVLPAREQIQGEAYRPGDRLKFFVKEVKKIGQKVKITLSRTSPEFLLVLFELEVPEITDGTIEIMSIAREPGRRSKVAVKSKDPKIDSVGACVGVAGARIKSIVNELNGEKIDIVKWSEDTNVYIGNALKPAEGAVIVLDKENHCAYVSLPDDQLSLAIGKHGQNVRLASKLVSWEIEIESPLPEEEDENKENISSAEDNPGSEHETSHETIKDEAENNINNETDEAASS